MDNQYKAAGHLVKRFAEHHMDPIKLPDWAVGAVIITSLVFFPMFIFLDYTLRTLYPTLAMVEDASGTYEPVALNEEAADESATPSPPPRATTASLRSINRLLYSIGGWRSSFRGIICALAIAISTAVVGGIFSAIPWVGTYIGTLLASLALVQLETCWVHVAISGPNKLPFYRRLPPFKKTFEATCFPVFFVWIGQTVMRVLPLVMAMLMGLPIWKPEDGKEVPKYDHSVAWKAPVIGITMLAVFLLLVIPARVVLTRVQASMLPPDEDPIVSFDRSFDGKVEPSIVGGKGYVTAKDALKSFPRSSWRRLYILYIKTVLVSLAGYAVFMAVLVPEVFFMAKHSEKVN